MESTKSPSESRCSRSRSKSSNSSKTSVFTTAGTCNIAKDQDYKNYLLQI